MNHFIDQRKKGETISNLSHILESRESLKICISLKSLGNYFSKVTAYKWTFAFLNHQEPTLLNQLKQLFIFFPVDQNFIKLFFNAPWVCLLWIYITQPYPLSLIKFVCSCFERFSLSAAKVGKNQGTLIPLWHCQSIKTWILILGGIVTLPRWACQVCWQRALDLIEYDVCMSGDEACRWHVSFSPTVCTRG